MPLECSSEEALGGCQVPSFIEPELDRVAIAHEPLCTSRDVPSGCDSSLACIEAIQTSGRIADNPSANGRMIDRGAALSHHLLKISEAQIVGQIPPDAEQDHSSPVCAINAGQGPSWIMARPDNGHDRSTPSANLACSIRSRQLL